MAAAASRQSRRHTTPPTKTPPRAAAVGERAAGDREIGVEPCLEAEIADAGCDLEATAAIAMREARRHEGDPGPVLPRRLSNAEYNNTIRDLTGADIRPAREFPVDPANQAGFDNSGESLAMSPALLKNTQSRRTCEAKVRTRG